MLLCHIAQTAEEHSLGQGGRGLYVLVEGIVDHEVERSAHVGHIALEHLVGIDRYLQPVEVEAIVGSEAIAYLCVFVLFLLSRGETCPFEIGKGPCPGRIQHLGAVPADHCLTLREKVDILLFCFHHSLRR